MKTFLGWLGVTAVIGLGGWALWQQEAARTRLQQEVRALRQEGHALSQLRAENQRLAALQPTAQEIDAARDERAAVARLRAEIEALQARVQHAVDAQGVDPSGRFGAGSNVPVGDWKNAGTATANAGLETVLWAAAGGDTEALARCLQFAEGQSRKQALALLESLPAALREQYGMPERLVAFLAIKDIPLGTAHVVGWGDARSTASPSEVHLQLATPEGPARELMLQFARTDASWRLVIPDSAIAKYTKMLKGTPPPPARAAK